MAFCNLDKAIYDGVGKYNIPEIDPYNGDIDVSHWLGFNYVKQDYYCRKEVGVHFCLDDYQFETIWNHPTKYIDNFKKCGILCSPDFSLYSDFPLAIQIYNHYRKHWLARFYQDRGSVVIPTIAWSDESSYDWCFDGEPKHSIVATSYNGMTFTVTKGTHFKAEKFANAVNTAKLRGLDYNHAVDNWLTANQKRYGYKYTSQGYKNPSRTRKGSVSLDLPF